MHFPMPNNEPLWSLGKGESGRIAIQNAIKKVKSEVIEIPLIIGGKEVRTNDIKEVRIPHDHQHIIARYHRAGVKEVEMAIQAATEARKTWGSLTFEDRAAIFLKLADHISGPNRAEIVATTMLNQSKNMYQAEIDCILEMVDFLRFNTHFAQKVYEEQPIQSPGVLNRMIHRPLDGFVYGITPFNFSCIALNLVAAPALMGNTTIWKPAETVVLSNYKYLKLAMECGLPAGVINFIPGDAAMITDTLLASPHLAGIHYTGSTAVFQGIFKKVAANMDKYIAYPRIVGEAGGKDFILAHSSADVEALTTALIRGAFEYQGQKCSAASRAYIPKSIWGKVSKLLKDELANVKTGNPEDPTVLLGAVIHKPSWSKCVSYIDYAKNNISKCTIVAGGDTDCSTGYFVSPTVIQVNEANDRLMTEEIFGPILAVYVYEDEKLFTDVVKLVDSSTKYALTGSIFAQDRIAINKLTEALDGAAGNFYINDKCTGAVVGQQPFGGSRMSGTNDKSGAMQHLLRWSSTRSIKETLVPAKNWRYPFMTSD